MIVAFFLLQSSKSSDYKEFERLKSEHTRISAELGTKAAILSEATSTTKQIDLDKLLAASRELSGLLEQVIEIDAKLAVVAEKEGIDPGKYVKRKEAEEALQAFYEKTMECVDIALQGKKEEFLQCDRETKPLFDEFQRITAEFQEEYR